MPDARDPHIHAHFSKAGLAEFRSTLSPERLEQDSRKLSVLFNEAAKSPELKDALDWATEHGVEFIVDRNMGAAGMYHTGTGVLAVSDELFQPGMRGEAVATLAHEIRHAWQDWNGLLPTHASSFLGFYIRQSVLEADAEAHGLLAYQQWGLRRMLDLGLAEKAAGDNSITQRELDELREDIRLAQEDPAPILWDGFVHWFELGAAEAYGLMSASGVGKEMGLPGADDITRDNPDIAETEAPPEYDPYKFMHEPRRNRGVDIRTENGLAPLGRGFKDDGNYFDAAPEGYIEKKILSPSLAVSFYKAGERPHPVVTAIMQEERAYNANPFGRLGDMTHSWNQKDLRAFRDGLSEERRELEQKTIQRLFNLAAKSPVLKEALDWATSHGVEFLVDKTSQGVGGYYWAGTGVVTFSASTLLADDARFAGVAVHEIRHAWQDSHGMIATAETRFTDYNIKTALIEADATAHQKLAENQVYLSRARDSFEKYRPSLTQRTIESQEKSLQAQEEKALKNPAQTLWEGFAGWYKSWLPAVYGDTLSRSFAKELGVAGPAPKDFRLEFKPQVVPVTTGIDYTRDEQLRLLGQSFAGVNYFEGGDRKAFSRQFLSRSLSARFFSAAKKEIPAFISSIRKRERELRKQEGCPPLVFAYS